MLTSQIGTLLTLQDAHVNQGGELEKRKAFVGVDITPTVASGVTTVLGMEALADSIVLFGGQTNADPGNWPPNYLTVPGITFTYQKLWRGSSPQSFANAVVYSTVFAGKAFVIATMSDGSTQLFYDGVAILDSYVGKITNGATMNSAFVMQSLIDAVNATGVYTAAFSGADVLITGPVGSGSAYGVTITETGTIVLTKTLVSLPIDQVPGQYSVGSFPILAGSFSAGTNKVTSVKVGATQLLSASVDWTTSNDVTAAAIAANINAFSATSGYNAINVANVVTIYANVVGTAANNSVVEVIAAGNVCVDDLIVNFTGTGFNLDYINATNLAGAQASIITGAPLTYTTATTLAAFATAVAANINANSAVSGYVACAVGAAIRISQAKTRSDDKVVPVEVGITPAAGQTGGAGLVTADPLSVAITPTGIGLARSSKGDGVASQTGQQATVQAKGGIPPYTYQWFVTTNDPNNIRLLPTNPTLQSTSLYGFVTKNATSGPLATHTATAEINCTVTDSNGQTTSGKASILLPP